VEPRGKVTFSEFADVRKAGYKGADMVGIAALSVQFLLTNFINNLYDTDVDLPAAAA
jgi:hypothetical protein